LSFRIDFAPTWAERLLNLEIRCEDNMTPVTRIGWTLAVWITCGSVFSGAIAAGQRPGPPPPPPPFGPSTLVRPGYSLERAIHQLAATSNVPIGFESAELAEPKVAIAIPFELRGKRVETALPQLLGADARYAWKLDKGVFVIRPVDSSGKPISSFLDKEVSIDVDDGTLVTVANRIRESFALFARFKPLPENAESRTSLSTKFSAHGRTIVALLTDAVRNHGTATWAVTFRQVNPSSKKLSPEISFRAFDGANIAFGVTPVN